MLLVQIYVFANYAISNNKGKLGEDVGQPGIRTGDTRVSHTSPKGECGTPWYHQ